VSLEIGREAGRKSLHVAAALSAAATLAAAPPPLHLPIFLAAFGTAALVEAARFRSLSAAGAFERVFGPLLREPERHRPTGATTLAAGFALAVLLFPAAAAALGILVAGLADAGAALAGRRFGTRRIAAGRTLEGSTACFAIAFAVTWAFPGFGMAAAALIAGAVTVAEALPFRVDDNIFLPPIVAGVATLLGAVGV
jgi:dolichol kinase